MKSIAGITIRYQNRATAHSMRLFAATGLPDLNICDRAAHWKFIGSGRGFLQALARLSG
ncbi:hypothetical protein [Pseudomonas vancouverensis]|uniref:hypothetical protein n=1 Tax=Pseudomonas vancouverensis TaxID=95300 RepID=UPI0014047B94|nr:hypothetical protein [Pseudomonas vancouverensis]